MAQCASIHGGTLWACQMYTTCMIRTTVGGYVGGSGGGEGTGTTTTTTRFVFDMVDTDVFWLEINNAGFWLFLLLETY